MTIIPRITPPPKNYHRWTPEDDAILVEYYAVGWWRVNAAFRAAGRPERKRANQRQRICTLRKQGKLHAVETAARWKKAEVQS